MNKYEAMFIIKPDLSEEERKTVFQQISDAVTKRNGALVSAGIWSEKRKLIFPIKKHHEGIYYLVNFNAAPESIREMNNTYKLNDNILRVLISRMD